MAAEVPSFDGIVAAGGRSTRFGADKAFAEVGGQPMVTRVAAALTDAGAASVVVVGGDAPRLAALGLDTTPDLVPDAGPLVALMSGLAWQSNTLSVFAACDLPGLRADTVRLLLGALVAAPTCLAAVPVVDGVRQWHLLALWQSAGALLEDAFTRGVRSLHEALEDAPLLEVRVPDPAPLADVDEPSDLDRYASQTADPRQS